MAGKPSARLIAAMQLLLENDGKPAHERLSAYACAKKTGITYDALYRSRLYKSYKSFSHEEDEELRCVRLALLSYELGLCAADCAARC